MKVHAPQPSLRQALSIVARAARPGATMPILAAVLLATTEDGSLHLAATDLEMVILSQIDDCRVEGTGGLAVPARLLTQFIGSLPPDAVTLTVNGHRALRVDSLDVTATIHGIDAQDFPDLPTLAELTPLATIPAGLLRDMIRQVVFAAAPVGDSRPDLTGVCLRLAGAEITLAATNRQRLALRRGHLTEPAGDCRQFIVPARALSDLAAVLDDPDAGVTIALAPERASVCFVAPPCLLMARVIAGDYPDYEQYLPMVHTTRIVVDSQALALAAQRADLFEAGSDARVALTVDGRPLLGDGRRLVVTAQGQETGASTTTLAADVTGAAARVELNGRYLREALRALGPGPVALESQAATAPCLIRPTGDDQRLQLIMPYGPAR